MLHSVAFTLLAGASAALAAPSVSVSFSGAKAVQGVDNFKFNTKITNTGSETLRLLKDPNSLLTPNWATETFHVESAHGVVPAFKGVRVKYGPKIAAAEGKYETLAPGESVQVEHSLAGVYNFTEAGESLYTVKPSSIGKMFTNVKADGSLEKIQATLVSDLKSQLSGETTPKEYVSLKSRHAKRANSFVSCSSSRQSDLKTAASNAQTYANNAYSYLSGISSGTTRYTTWFGTYSSSNKATVYSHYGHIKDGQLSTDTFDCTCTDTDTYAYVYPDTFGYIYLCGAFWQAPATGTDSKAGTLIHESSHFTKNGGTQDYVYGQSSAKSLAKSNPSKAIFNADNHEYFAENNPAQS